MKWSDKLILTDADGVLLDWVYGFDRWILSKHGKLPVKYDVYGVHNRYDIERSVAKEMVVRFNESAAIGWLPALKDSVKYVRKLHEDHGYVFHCITSMGNDEYAMKLRKKNLEALFGKTAFERIEILDTGADKDEALEKYRDTGCVWIEDKPANALVGVEMGLTSYLMGDDYNASFEDDRIKRVESWSEIYESITGEKS